MAREFNGTSDGLFTNSALSPNQTNFTMGGWFYLDANNCCLMSNGHDNGVNSFSGYAITVNSTNKINYLRNGLAFHATATDWGLGAWHHIVLTRGATNTTIYYDGTDIGPNVTSNPYTPSTAFSIGCHSNNGSDATARFLNGQACEVAFWERALSPSEILSLSRGYSSLFYPKSLIFYLSMYGTNSPERDTIRSTVMTVDGTTKSPHPLIVYPTPQQITYIASQVGFVPRLSLLGVG